MRSLVLCAALLAAPLSAAALPAVAVAATAEETAKVETLLHQTIADIQAGTPKFETMSMGLAEAVRTQKEAGQQLAALGPVTGMVREGEGTDPYVYAVTFQTGATLKFSISASESGIITGLSVTG